MDTHQPDMESQMKRGLAVIEEIRQIGVEADVLLARGEEKIRLAKVIFGSMGFNQKKVAGMMPALPKRIKADAVQAPPSGEQTPPEQIDPPSGEGEGEDPDQLAEHGTRRTA